MPSPALSLLVYSGHLLLYCCPARASGAPAYGLALLAQHTRYRVLLAQNPVPGTGHSRVVTALTSV